MKNGIQYMYAYLSVFIEEQRGHHGSGHEASTLGDIWKKREATGGYDEH